MFLYMYMYYSKITEVDLEIDVYLYLFTDCFMTISLQSAEQISEQIGDKSSGNSL